MVDVLNNSLGYTVKLSCNYPCTCESRPLDVTLFAQHISVYIGHYRTWHKESDLHEVQNQWKEEDQYDLHEQLEQEAY